MAEVQRPMFKVKRRVTEQLIKFEVDTEYFVRFDGAIVKAKETEGSRRQSPDQPKKEPPYLAQVTMLDDGTQGVIIVPHVLRSDILDAYPDDGYVNLCFRLVKHKLESKAYSTWEIAEIELDNEPAAADHLPLQFSADEVEAVADEGDSETEATGGRRKRK